MNSFLQHFGVGMNLEILSLDLRCVLNAMGEITGETTPDEILDYIFQRFCIGK
jgi:tRNA modification GTPase